MKKVSSARKKKQMKALDRVVRNRILLLALLIFGAFGVLTARLIYLQAVQHDEYVVKQDDYVSIRQYTQAPRGQIYDVKGRVLAKTVPARNIVYTAPNNTTTEDDLLYADRVATVFEVPLDAFSETELKEAYLTWTSLLERDDPRYLGLDLLSDAEREAYQAGSWGQQAASRLYSLQMKAIAQDDLDEVGDKDLIIYAIYNRMMANASTGQESVILPDADDSEVAYLVEHKTEFPGFDVDFGGWKREYPYGESLSDILGTVSTSTEGLPASSKDHYLAQGYQLNAQVGKSGLEYQYNDILTGTEEIAKITYDSNGLARKEVIQTARKGNDIYLSIDIDVQVKLDEVLKKTLQESGGTKNRENFQSLFMCMMNPESGDLYALSGYQKDLKTGAMTYYASGNYTTLVNPGSCIKGVTVYMGQSEGVVREGEVINDTVMNLGGEQFGSFENHGLVDDVQALSVSSNVYMFNIAMRLGGDSYEEGQALQIDDVEGTLNTMRNYYSMFGLGNPTGIDVPGEITSYMGVNHNPGMVLNYSIGQFDMYTPLQLLQYVSVVAADGTMYRPTLFDYAKEVNGDQILDLKEPEIRSILPEENSSHLKRVQEGFRACVADGNCFPPLENFDVPVAAKTGTAEVQEVWTTANLVGYAPYDYEKPTVSFACVAPTSSVNNESVSANICANEVVEPVLARFFELYPYVPPNSPDSSHSEE